MRQPHEVRIERPCRILPRWFIYTHWRNEQGHAVTYVVAGHTLYWAIEAWRHARKHGVFQ